jgi:hypothetical protein
MPNLTHRTPGINSRPTLNFPTARMTALTQTVTRLQRKNTRLESTGSYSDNGQRWRFSSTMTSTVPLSRSYTLFSAHRNEPNKHKYVDCLIQHQELQIQHVRDVSTLKKELKNLQDNKFDVCGSVHLGNIYV